MQIDYSILCTVQFCQSDDKKYVHIHMYIYIPLYDSLTALVWFIYKNSVFGQSFFSYEANNKGKHTNDNTQSKPNTYS